MFVERRVGVNLVYCFLWVSSLSILDLKYLMSCLTLMGSSS